MLSSDRNKYGSTQLSQIEVPDDFVVVSRKDLSRLVQAIRSVKNSLPHVISNDIVDTYRIKDALEQELTSASNELEALSADRDHWKTRYDSICRDIQHMRKDLYESTSHVQQLTEQLNQQIEYCASMGSACSTLLWRVSRVEDSVTTLLSGTKTEEFLELVSATVDSYTNTFADDCGPAVSQSGNEAQFILALCGIITNIAASPFGREYLGGKQSGRHLIDTFVSVVYNIPPKMCPRIKTVEVSQKLMWMTFDRNVSKALVTRKAIQPRPAETKMPGLFHSDKRLMLMAMYNISINQKGLHYLRSKPNFITRLAWILQGEEDVECRLNVLRLVQSLLYDEENSPMEHIHEAVEVLSRELLLKLTSDSNANVRSVASEVLTILHSVPVEP